jgi:hypothetical protein
MNLQQKFESVVELYVEAFLRKHGFFDDDTGEYLEYSWAGCNIGTIIEVADRYIAFDDIRHDIDHAIPKDRFFEWYEYCLENETKINYKSFLMGAR